MIPRSQFCLFLAAAVLVALPIAAQAKHASSTNEENLAVVLGETGEKYPIYGAGGIKVTGGHHGMWTSNMKSSAIQIDGSGISAQKFMPVNENTDFSAAADGAYFVSSTCVCTLPTAAGYAGEEIVVCNTSTKATITYQTVAGESLIGGDQSRPLENAQPGKVDRFISDGRCWYRE